jgi:hypothetical protein
MVPKSSREQVRPTGLCFCGCGGRTAANRHFIITHDRIAETAVIREFYGSIANFVAHHRGVPVGGRRPYSSRRTPADASDLDVG